MTTPATDFRLGDLGQAQQTFGPDIHPTSEAEQAGRDASLKHQVRAGVRQQETRDAAATAQVRPPRRTARILRDQPAFLTLTAPLKVLEVVWALGAGGRSHCGPDQARVRYCPVRVSTRILSPVWTNSGTCTRRPVSVVTVLVAPVAVSPLTPASA